MSDGVFRRILNIRHTFSRARGGARERETLDRGVKAIARTISEHGDERSEPGTIIVVQTDSHAQQVRAEEGDSSSTGILCWPQDAGNHVTVSLALAISVVWWC